MTDRRADSNRLTRADLLRLGGLVLLGALTLALGLHLYPTVFPEATIKFDVDRGASRAVAERLLREHGFEIAGLRYASAFQYDDSAKVFLEKELGLEAMNEAVEGGARIWQWSHRWFKPLQKEEFRVGIAPTGELVRFTHLLDEDAPGARLEEGEALRRAEDQLRALRSRGLDDLRYLGATSVERKNRTDHAFTWERPDIDWKGGRYRHRVTIQGDRLGGYEEFVQVPETWARDYARLRSKNLSANAVANVFGFLTILAMLVILVQQVRLRAIRWRFAIGFGAVAAALLFVNNLNGLPQALFRYETTRSYAGFLSERILLGLAASIALGFVILIMVACGENIYRSSYPRKLAIPSFFRWEGLRTKEFLFSSLAGLVLTCFFLAYQTVFYRIASSLGAWSPADVPYDDLLNSAVPWVFLLFIGFMPAVTEEFTSRVFSIPFFQRFLRSRALALILAAFIWGFGHSAYPNQPFYIRGLEVGLAGILMGVLMLRFNVFMLLVWHYTVDALYSGYLLFRSGNPYYVTTAALAGGILILPFAVALVAYLRTGRFVDPVPLRNEAQPVPAPGEAVDARAAGEIMREGEAAGIGTIAVPPPAAAGLEGAVLSERPLTARRAIVALGVSALALAAVVGLRSGSARPEAPLRTDRATAMATARAFAATHGFDTSGCKSAVTLNDEADPIAARYVLSKAGFSAFAGYWPERLPAQSWAVRFFRPLDPAEARARIDLASGRVIAFDHRIAEADSLPPVSLERAEELAASLLGSVGFDTAPMDRKEAADKPRPKRMDRTFAWEAPEGDPRNVAQARYRIEGKVTGDRAAGFDLKLRVPEEYERAREKRTVAWPTGLALLLLGGGGLLGLAIRDVGRAHGRGAIPWRRLLPGGLAGIVVAVVGTLNAMPRLLTQYSTSAPWMTFIVFACVGVITAALFYFLVGWAGTALTWGLHPRVALLGRDEIRRRWLPGAALALVLFPVWGKVLAETRVLIAKWAPGVAPPPIAGAAGPLDASLPGLSAFIGVILATFVLCLAFAVMTRVLSSRDWPGRSGRIALLGLLALGLSIMPSRGGGEFILLLARYLLILAIGAGLIVWILRGNVLAYIAGVYGYHAVRATAALLGEPNGWARAHGVAAAILLAIPLVWVWARSRKRAAAV